MVIRVFCVLCVLAIPFCAVECQSYLGVMTYNCENAFDVLHDDGHDDLEFTADGVRRWTRWKSNVKLRNIAKVVMAADSLRPVDIVCLCEVENDSVMERLTKRGPLGSVGYEYVITDSPDRRGIDVALMFIPFTFRKVETQCLRHSADSETRDVLRVAGVLLTGDTLDVYGVHLPSKLNGKKGDMLRSKIVKMLKSNIDSVMSVRLNGQILVMGDFNDDADSDLLAREFGVGNIVGGVAFEPEGLYNLVGVSEGGKGTYKYKGIWSVIDQVVVNGNMLTESNGVVFDRAHSGIVDKDFLLESDWEYGGKKPKRSFVGVRFMESGYSDHLPVYVRFEYNFNGTK